MLPYYHHGNTGHPHCLLQTWPRKRFQTPQLLNYTKVIIFTWMAAENRAAGPPTYTSLAPSRLLGGAGSSSTTTSFCPSDQVWKEFLPSWPTLFDSATSGKISTKKFKVSSEPVKFRFCRTSYNTPI